MLSPPKSWRSNSRVTVLTNGSFANEDISNSVSTVKIAKEFLKSTSIHGMKYVGQSNRHIFERLCWSCFVIMGLVGSAYSCYLEWCKWQNSPLSITQDPTIASHEPLHFPDVTLCSTHRLSDKKIKLILQDPLYSWMNLTFFRKTMRYVVKFDASANQENEVNRIGSTLAQHNMDINDLIQIVERTSISCDEFFLECLWQSKILPCEKLFTPILTDDGICCSLREVSKTFMQTQFRSANIKNLTSPYVDDAIDEYGVSSALRILLDVKNTDSSLVVSMFDGFKILLHNENEFPDVMKRGFVVAAGFEHYVALNSISVYYTPAIPAIAFDRRECYVEGEGELTYSTYSTYARSACRYECRINAVLAACGCLPYYIDIKAPNQSIPKCPLEAYPCVAAVYVGGKAAYSMGGQKKCHCPRTCNEQWYTTEISTVPFSVAGLSNSRHFRRITKMKNVTATSYAQKLVGLRIFFRYNAGDSYKMDAPYGTKEFIASCGGLLSLGLGFSVISAVELIYFLCIRCCFRKNDRSYDRNNENRASSQSDSRYSVNQKGLYLNNTLIKKDNDEDLVRVLAPGEFLKRH